MDAEKAQKRADKQISGMMTLGQMFQLITIDNKVFQSGVFNVALNNGSEWNTVNSSVIDTLAVNNISHK